MFGTAASLDWCFIVFIVCYRVNWCRGLTLCLGVGPKDMILLTCKNLFAGTIPITSTIPDNAINQKVSFYRGFPKANLQQDLLDLVGRKVVLV